MPTFVTTRLHLPPATGYIATIVLALMVIVLCPLAGHLADRIGPTRMMLPAAVLMVFSFYPVFLLITRHPSLPTLMAGLIWDALLQVTYLSGLSPVMASLFPAR